jgi:hypothetical protein
MSRPRGCRMAGGRADRRMACDQMAGVDPGLCRTCMWSRLILTGRGSAFWRCGRSDTDVRYPKYPPLPVRSCEGHEARSGGDDAR